MSRQRQHWCWRMFTDRTALPLRAVERPQKKASRLLFSDAESCNDLDVSLRIGAP